MNRVLLLGALAMLVGCGGDDHAPSLVVKGSGGSTAGGRSNKGGSAGRAGSANAGTSGRGGSGGSAGRTSTGGDATTAGTTGDPRGDAGSAGYAGGGFLPTGPIVTITSPAVAVDPNSANVLTQDSIDVTCSATAGSTPGSTVDPFSVEIVLIQDGETIAPTGTPKRDSLKGTTSTFSLATAKSGSAVFECTASDGTSADLRGTATLSTWIDRGPTFRFLTPTNKELWNLRKQLTVEFYVDPTKLSASDTLAEIDTATVALAVDGRSIHIDRTLDGTYKTAPITLTEPPFTSNDLPSGLTIIQASASNVRKASGTGSVSINVDDQKPDIKVLSPTTGQIVAGEIALTFDVEDPKIGTEPGSGVNEVKVVVNERPFIYDPNDKLRWTHTGTFTYIFNFTQADLVGSKAQATIQISASDFAGNVNTGGVSLVLYIDAQPPIVDLDPPTLRELFLESGKLNCSSAFDPLGEAVNDRTLLTKPGTFRAFVWDETNDPGEGLARYLSLTDQASVSLWIQDDTRVPLLADADHDGICDSIDPGTAASPARSVKLSPVTPIGTGPAYGYDDLRFWSAPPVGSYTVSLTSRSATQSWLCNNNSDMVRVVKHAVASSTPEPVVYGLDPSTSTVECTGRWWETGIFADTPTSITEGWVCLAATASDKVKNVGISRVLRVCYDNPDTTEVPECATNLFNANAWPASLPWVQTSGSAQLISQQYPAQPNCPCEVGQNFCAPLDPNQPAYCSAKKTNCNGTDVTNPCKAGEKRCFPSDPNRMAYCVASTAACSADADIALSTCGANQKLCYRRAPSGSTRCVALNQPCAPDFDTAAGVDFATVSIQCTATQKLCVSPIAGVPASCVPTSEACASKVDFTNVHVTCSATQKLCVPPNPAIPAYCVSSTEACDTDVNFGVGFDLANITLQCTTPNRLCVSPESGNAAACVPSSTDCSPMVDFTNVNTTCSATQRLCVPPNPANPAYCVSSAAACSTDVDFGVAFDPARTAVQCTTATQKLCLPTQKSSAPAHCVKTTESCTASTEIDVTLPAERFCQSNDTLCVPLSASLPLYCVDPTRRHCDSDVGVDLAQCPACPPTRYDLAAKKCKLAMCEPGDELTDETCKLENIICKPGDTTAGCQPEYTTLCPCGSLCATGTTNSPLGCTPYNPLPKRDPCAVPCRPPTNAAAIRYIRN